MKVAILFALVAVASAAVINPAGIVSTGSSSVSRSEDGTGNYQFSYTEQGLSGGSQRSEQGDAFGRKTGSYALSDADGRQRIVSYVADETGFRASIQTNEPGTAPLAGADTAISAPDSTGIAAATNQRTAEQLTALANAPPAVEETPVAAAPIAFGPAPTRLVAAQPVYSGFRPFTG
ncbi:adult-specific rigid cuticular protein 15.7 [Tetranychus urticae]|uniref:Cuticle protein 14 n=1 Tax=Tetranychus urticae TaxID=32264 RepID=T1JPM4_TETUR|nr:adult-specific rigid cuticular protein 15.7 [Tetranychus urticae]